MPVLENRCDPSGSEILYTVRDVTLGASYIFSVRSGDNHRWSAWSEPSSPLLVGIPPPIPSPGDVLEISCDVGTSSSVRLEWRPFRTSMNLSRVEYKVMALEWPFPDASRDNKVLAQLRRAAQETQQGLSRDIAGQRSFYAVGYVTTKS